MTRSTRRYIVLAVWAILTSILSAVSGFANAESSINGMWNYVAASDLDNPSASVRPFPAKAVQIVDQRLTFSSNCMVELTSEKYYFSEVFQMELKRGTKSEQVARHLQEKLSFDLSRVKYALKFDDTPCARDFEYAMFDGEKLVFVYQGSIFYLFNRPTNPTAFKLNSSGQGGQKTSRLPFNVSSFQNLCVPHIRYVKEVPQPTNKCAPDFYPYVATKNSVDPLSKIVGAHDYDKKDPKYSQEYGNPVLMGLHPVYLVLPPLKDVTLVRVFDLDPGAEERNVFRGAYISIVGGKVVDQLNEGCTFSEEYVCSYRKGEDSYKLLESGKFQKVR